MEPLPLPTPESGDATGTGNDAIIIYPPRYQKNEEQGTNIWLRSAYSLALYLIIGFLIFRSFSWLLLITAIVMIHELGHFFAMKFYRYKELGIFFIPLLGAYVSGSKREVSQRESAVILFAGPLPGIIIGSILYLLYLQNTQLEIAGISFYDISIAFIFLNLLNLAPVYPLDGGQLLNRVFLDEESWISKGFILLSIGALCWFALFAVSGRASYVLLIFPAMMLFRMFGDSKLNNVEKKVETEGFDLDKSYEDLSNEDYWKIRSIVVREHPSFKDVVAGPPFEYDDKEERIMTTIQSLLHRHLIQDVTIAGKILIAIIWITAILSPWLLDLDLWFLRRFGL